MTRAYVDTNIASAVAKEEDEHKEAAAFVELQAMPEERLSLCTSRLMEDELGRIPPEHRRRHTEFYEALTRVPYAPDSFQMPRMLTSQHSGPTGGPIVHLEEVGKIESLLHGGRGQARRDDAVHLFQAVQNGVDYFVTVDVSSILSAREAIEAACPIRLRLPTELLGELAPD